MILNRFQLDKILESPFFSNDVTTNVTQYKLYRGRTNVKVFTIRFNILKNFNENKIVTSLINILLANFELDTKILCNISYDLILEEPRAQTYYIWRANSNQTNFNEDEEKMFIFTYNNLYQLVQESVKPQLSSLNIYFANSNVVIRNCCAIVFSFIRTQ